MALTELLIKDVWIDTGLTGSKISNPNREKEIFVTTDPNMKTGIPIGGMKSKRILATSNLYVKSNSTSYIRVILNSETVAGEGEEVEMTYYFFNSIAEMKASTDLTVGDVAITTGYYAEGDGGASEYLIVASGTGTDNGGTYHDLTGISGQAKLVLKDRINIRQFGAKGDNITLDTVAIQTCMNYCATNGIPMESTRGTYLIHNNDGGAYALELPSNLTWYTDETAFFQLDADQRDWTRAISAGLVENINIHGILRIDGNGQNQTNLPNEQMHCVFLYGVRHVYIEGIHSTNAYGDCVCISGLGNVTDYSYDVTIDYIRAKTAGRKCLVIACCDRIVLGSVNLDNTLGGYAYGKVGQNCLDFEPFGSESTGKYLNAVIQSLYTVGTGDDFTIGTTDEHAKQFGLHIGQYVMEFMANKPESQFYSNGIYGYIDTLRILGDKNTTYTAPSVRFKYGATWNIKHLEIDVNSADNVYQVDMYAQADGRPSIRLGTFISRGKGRVLDCQGSSLSIDNLYVYRDATNVSTLANFRSTGNDAYIKIGNIFAQNINEITMTNYDVNLFKEFTVGNVTWKDERVVTGDPFFEVGLNINPILCIQNWNIPAGTYITDEYGTGSTYFKMNGKQYYSRSGTPEGLITADVGSTCCVENGGAGTSFYVKESGTGNTGWVAK